MWQISRSWGKSLVLGCVLGCLTAEANVFRLDFSGGAIPDVPSFGVGDRLELVVPDKPAACLTLVERLPSGVGGTSYLAEVDGDGGMKNAVVVVSSDGLQISARHPKSRVQYVVTAGAHGVRVWTEDPATRGVQRPLPPLVTPPPAGLQNVARNVVAVNGPAYVDMLIAYDLEAKTWAVEQGGGLTNLALAAVAKMNAALANTGLDASFRFRLVGVTCVDDAAYGDLSWTLQAATYGWYEWEDLHKLREACGADIVTTFIDTGSAYGTTGLSHALTADYAGAISAFEDLAFNVCSVRAVATSHTMTHEIGHVMGCGHARSQEVDPGPQYNDYSSGYYFTVNGAKYHTIMAYDEKSDGDVYEVVPYFSSPSHFYEGVAVGTAEDDNTRTLRETFAAVAAFREAKVSTVEQGEKVTAPPEWSTTRSDALQRAQSAGKRIVMVCGRDSCGNTSAVRGYLNNYEAVKQILADGFVCWFDNCDAEGTWLWFYCKEHSITLPFVCIIDPGSPLVARDSTIGWMSCDDLIAFLEDNAYAQTAITLGKNGGSGGTGSVTATRGSALPTISVPMKANAIFSGYWTTCGEGGIQYYRADGTGARTWNGRSSKRTLWAKWTNRLTFGKNGGTGGDNYVTAVQGQMPHDITVPKKSGATFAGYWTTCGTGGVQYYGADGKATRAWDKTVNLQLWAKWTNRLTFGKNGGAGGDNYVTAVQGQVPHKVTPPTRAGYVFDGYWTTVNNGVAYFTADGQGTRAWSGTKDVTLWAKWVAGTGCKVTLGLNGGTGGAYVYAAKGKAMPRITPPTRAGYTFAGYWTTVNAGGVKYYNADGTSARNWDKSAATTLWAKWTKNGSANL